MKKIWTVLLAGAMSISLVACQGADSQETVQTEIESESTQQAETEEIAESEETKAEERQKTLRGNHQTLFPQKLRAREIFW